MGYAAAPATALASWTEKIFLTPRWPCALVLELVGEVLVLADPLVDRPLSVQGLPQLPLEARHLTGRESSTSPGCPRRSRRPAPRAARLVLGLVQGRHHALAERQRPLGLRVELRSELREGLQLTVRASSRRRRPATFFIAFVWAFPPTRLTEMPTLMAGRTPEKKRSDSRKI